MQKMESLVPSLNRRSFLQAVGAVGLTPLLPSIAGSGAGVAKGSVSASKALWASLYANSGSTAEFVGVARNIGLSNSAIQGVSARSVGVRLAVAASAETISAQSVKHAPPPLSANSSKLNLRDQFKRGLDELLADDRLEEVVVTREDAHEHPMVEEDITPELKPHEDR
jgi:hypothetical protein